VGCDTDGDDGGNLIGTWYGTGTPVDSYIISGDSITYDDGSDGMYGMSFAADIVQYSDFEDDSGVLIIEFTKNPNEGGSKNFNAVYWRNLSADQVELANAAAKASPWDSSVDTLEEAETKFTKDDADDFVDWSQVAPYRKGK
jgi:hypothetical protein